MGSGYVLFFLFIIPLAFREGSGSGFLRFGCGVELKISTFYCTLVFSWSCTSVLPWKVGRLIGIFYFLGMHAPSVE